MMKTQFLTLKSFVLVILITLISCKKDTPAGGSAALAKCTIKSETTALIGNEGRWEYTVDDKGRPSVIKSYNSIGMLEHTSTVNELVVTHTAAVGGKNTHVYDANIHSALPSKVNVSLTSSTGVEQRDYNTFNFFYDTKGRLAKVKQQTPNTAGDYEYDLTITYNDKDNVTSLKYELTTGPRTVTFITVAAYDDKPTPYAAIQSWKFLASRFAWDNYDPEPILTALSKNNPLDYTLGQTPNQWNRTMVYQYNGDGFPIERKNTNQSPNGTKSTFVQTYAYNCN